MIMMMLVSSILYTTIATGNNNLMNTYTYIAKSQVITRQKNKYNLKFIIIVRSVADCLDIYTKTSI